MRFRSFAWSITGSAAMLLAGCSSNAPLPTATATAFEHLAETSATAVEAPQWVLVEGSVADDAGRPLAKMQVECMGAVTCMGLNDISAQDGRDFSVATDANGHYRFRASRQPANTSGGFLMCAAGRGFEIAWREVTLPTSSCSSSDGCSMRVNFTMTPQLD
jgi:hypothetical protein